MEKKIKGITLIALVVTIVILLILAAVSMSIVTGQSGIFTRTKDAKTATEIAKEKETISTSYMSVETGNADATVTVAELNKEINNELNGETATVEGKDNGPFYITYNKSGRTYSIDSTGKASENKSDIVNPNKNLWPGWPRAEDAGTENNPYKIYCIEDLAEFSRKINDGDTNIINAYISIENNLDYDYPGSYYDYNRTDFNDINEDGKIDSLYVELTSSYGWKAIGKEEYGKVKSFRGTLDAKNHEIANLYINKTSSYNGFFGYADNGLTIKNIYLKNIDLKDIGERSGGILAYGTCNGEAKFTFENCKASGNIYSKSISIGGLVGMISGSGNSALSISKCENDVNINANGYSGGIIGEADINNIIIENSINNGNIKCNSCKIAGILGYDSNDITNGKITNCCNNGNITAASYISGICSNSYGINISNCFNRGDINSSDILNSTHIAGISASIRQNDTIENCYNIGNISGGRNISGISGRQEYPSDKKTINNCYNLGTITGEDEVSGIISNTSTINISNCYSIEKIESNKSEGAIVAIVNDINSLTMSNCFYLKGISTIGNGNYYDSTKKENIGYPDKAGVVESIDTLSEIKSKLITYFLSQDGWKADTNNINNGYPILSWQ